MRTIIIIGPLPPPVHGVTVAIQRVMESHIGKSFNLVHLDTSDHRDVSTIGRFDFLNYWLAIKSYLVLAWYLMRYKPVIVYVPISQSWIGYIRDSIYFIITRLLSRAKIIIHLHGGHFGSFYEKSSRVTKKYVDFTMSMVSRTIVLADCFQPIFEHWFNRVNIDIVQNGTDMILEGTDEKLSRENVSIRNITFLSSLMRTKGIQDFVKAAVLCLENNPDLQFHIAGEWWSEDKNIKKETLDLIEKKYAGNIRFHGLVTGEKRDSLFIKTDIFSLPTYYPFEGQPTVIIEAMAAGVPVISTNHAAIPETVIDGVTGILVPKRNHKMLARAILDLSSDPARWKSMANASYQRYKSFYTTLESNERLLASFQRATDLNK